MCIAQQIEISAPVRCLREGLLFRSRDKERDDQLSSESMTVTNCCGCELGRDDSSFVLPGNALSWTETLIL